MLTSIFIRYNSAISRFIAIRTRSYLAGVSTAEPWGLPPSKGVVYNSCRYGGDGVQPLSIPLQYIDEV